MSSKFGKIRPWTTELAALEHLKKIPLTYNRENDVIYFSPLFMPPTLKKWGAYCFRLVRVCVRLFVRPSVQKNVKGRDLKFHIWIPRPKIAYPYFFSCPNYFPLPSYAPFKG